MAGSKARAPSARVLLVAVLNGRSVGHIHQDRRGRFRFVYDEAWRGDPDAYPISLSLPLASPEHTHAEVNAYLWGLLPDNDRTLQHYGRRFGVSAGNPAALLAHLGADCVGAIQFAAPDATDAILGRDAANDQVEWLTESQVADELRTVRTRGALNAGPHGTGQFSLPGAQPKTALLFENGRWGRPAGRIPTNTILKPPTGQFDGFAENEHICLEFARRVGLDAVNSRVMRFDEEIAIVVDRYDRTRRRGERIRIHQEDICQALGVMPALKYESEGGPGVRDIVALIRLTSKRAEEDVDRFVDATILNWILAATDAHAKNYALLHGPGGVSRLAPFYDIASYLPYADAQLHRVKLAMRIGNEYLVRRIGRVHWQELAKSLGMRMTVMEARIDRLIASVMASLDHVRATAIDGGLDPAVVRPLVDAVRRRTAECQRLMRP